VIIKADFFTFRGGTRNFIGGLGLAGESSGEDVSQSILSEPLIDAGEKMTSKFEP